MRVRERAIELLRDLRSALLRSVSGSEEGRRVLAKVRRAGLSVYLVVDGGDEEEPETIPLLLSGMPESESRPTFRIDTRDLTILRDLGIDPTRTLRRRR